MVATGLVLAALVFPTAYGALSPRNFALSCIAVAAISFFAVLRAFKAAERSSNPDAPDAVDRTVQKYGIAKYIVAAL